MSAGFPGGIQMAKPAFTEEMLARGETAMVSPYGGMTPGDALGGGLTLTDPLTGLPRGQTAQAPGAYAGRNFGPGDLSTPFLGRPAQAPAQQDPGVFLDQPVDTPRVFDQPQPTPFLGLPAPEQMPQQQFAQPQQMPQQMPQSQQQPGLPPAPQFPQFGTVIPQQAMPVVQQILNRPRLFGPAPGTSITQQGPQIRLPQMTRPAQPVQSLPLPRPPLFRPMPIMRPGFGLRGQRFR